VIATLKLRDNTVAISTSNDGLRYTVTAADGQVRAVRITERELAKQHAELYRVVRFGFASDSEQTPYLDGRLDPSFTRPTSASEQRRRGAPYFGGREGF